MVDRETITIVYPAEGSDFYKQLARRLATACSENSRTVSLYSSAEVRDMESDHLADEAVLIVNPWECSIQIGDSAAFFSTLSGARRRITVLAEAAGFEWFTKQFELPLHHEMLIDVGFVSQEDKLQDLQVPYRFLSNSATREEERMLEQATPYEKPIPWAFIGHNRQTRINLAAQLVDELDPGGFVFLPDRGRGVKEGQGTIGPLGLSALLSRTKYYIWNSLHEFEYYESFRFREAVLAGAVPCKIDDADVWRDLDVPGIFPSVGALLDDIHSEGFDSMWHSTKEYYLSQGTLADNLEEILRDV